MSDDERLLTLLVAIRAGDERGQLMTNDLLVEHLGWSPDQVAAQLGEARAQMLIWGIRTGGMPKPHFAELEVTVQGARRLRQAAAAGKSA